MQNVYAHIPMKRKTWRRGGVGNVRENEEPKAYTDYHSSLCLKKSVHVLTYHDKSFSVTR